jgi:hypothetical protein
VTAVFDEFGSAAAIGRITDLPARKAAMSATAMESS